MTKISLGLKIDSESNVYQEMCYLYDTSVAMFILISSAFVKNTQSSNMSSNVHLLSNLEP